MTFIKKTNYKHIPKNIIIITSVLDCPIRRNLFTREERFEQTKKTIDSVRVKIPNSFIIIIDVTVFTEEEHNFFKSSCNYIVNCVNNNEATYSVLQHDNKSFGERYYLLECMLVIHHLLEIYPNIRNIFKISGRYYLDNNFLYSTYDNDNIIVNLVDPLIWANACTTCFFKLPIEQLDNFYNQLLLSGNNISYGVSMEQFMYSYVMSNDISKYINVEHNELGVSGIVCAPDAVERYCNTR